MRSLLAAALVAGCKFEGAATDADAATESDAPVIADAELDAPPVEQNVVGAQNGGALVDFTSEFCTDCGGGAEWRASNVHDGSLGASAQGGEVYRRAVWCSAGRNPASPPERFELAFRDQRPARVHRIAIQNFGEGTYWATQFEAWVFYDETWTKVHEGTLAPTETIQDFALATPAFATRFALVILAGNDPNYIELGEVEVWGSLL